MDEFKVDEILRAKLTLEDNTFKKEYINKKKKRQPKEQKLEKSQENNQEKHIDIYV